MNLVIDTTRPSDSSLVKSSELLVPIQFPSLFLDDVFELKVQFVAEDSLPVWHDDLSAIVSFKIGTIETPISTKFDATKQGDFYVFDVDFRGVNPTAFVSGKDSANALAEIQVQYGGKIRTLLQKNFSFKNTFLDAENVVVVAPNNPPSLIEVELLTAPLAPSNVTPDKIPNAPSVLVLTFKPTEPLLVRVTNLSVEPNAPSLFDAIEKIDPPLAPSNVLRKLVGAPDIVESVEASLVDPLSIIEEPTQLEVKLLTRPIAPSWRENFLVVPNTYDEKSAEYLTLEITEGTLSSRRGTHATSEEVPFVNIGNGFATATGFRLSNDGLPIYERELDNEIFVAEDGVFRTSELMTSRVVYQAQNIQGIFPLFESEEIANLANQRGGATQKTIDSVDYWMPSGEEGKSNFNGTYEGDTSVGDIIETTMVLKYDFSGYYEVDVEGTMVEQTGTTFNFQHSRLFPTPQQEERLGLSDYGGAQIAYYNEEVQRDFINASFNILPATLPESGVVPNEDRVPLSPTKIEVATSAPDAPSLIEVVAPDFDVMRYNPSVWVDASRETSELPLDSLKNYGIFGANFVKNHRGEKTQVALQRLNGLRIYDFENGKKSYRIRNPFNEPTMGSQFVKDPDIPTAGEIEMFFVVRSYQSNNAHLVNATGQLSDRMIVHAPHNQQMAHHQVEVYDGSTTTNQGAHTQNDEFEIDQWHILATRFSKREGGLKLFVDGVLLDTKPAVGSVAFTEMLMGGWGNEVYGQHCHIAEVLFFKNKIGDTARQKVEGYLAKKWGLRNVLPASHPYKEDSPDNQGEVIEYERFLTPPRFVIVDSTPSAPTLPSVGILPDAPSEIFVSCSPANPSRVDSLILPPLSLTSDGVTQTANFTFRSYEGEEPKRNDQTLKEWLESLVAIDEFGNEVSTTQWALTQPTDPHFDIAISSSASSSPVVTTNQVVEYAPFGRNSTRDYELTATNGTEVVKLFIKLELFNVANNAIVSASGDFSTGYVGEIKKWVKPFFLYSSSTPHYEGFMTKRPCEVLSISMKAGESYDFEFVIEDFDFMPRMQDVVETTESLQFWDTNANGRYWYRRYSTNFVDLPRFGLPVIQRYEPWELRQYDRFVFTPTLATKFWRTPYTGMQGAQVMQDYYAPEYKPFYSPYTSHGLTDPNNPYWLYKVTNGTSVELSDRKYQYNFTIEINPDQTQLDFFNTCFENTNKDARRTLALSSTGQRNELGFYSFTPTFFLKGYYYNVDRYEPHVFDLPSDLEGVREENYPPDDYVENYGQFGSVYRYNPIRLLDIFRMFFYTKKTDYMIVFDKLEKPTRVRAFGDGGIPYDPPSNIEVKTQIPMLAHQDDWSIESVEVDIEKIDKGNYFKLNKMSNFSQGCANLSGTFPNAGVAEKHDWVWGWNINTMLGEYEHLPFMIHYSKLSRVSGTSQLDTTSKSIYYSGQGTGRLNVTGTEFLLNFPNGEQVLTQGGGYIQSTSHIGKFQVYYKNWDNLYQEFEISIPDLTRGTSTMSNAHIVKYPWYLPHHTSAGDNWSIRQDCFVANNDQSWSATKLSLDDYQKQAQSVIYKQLPQIMMPFNSTTIRTRNGQIPENEDLTSRVVQENAYFTRHHALQASRDGAIFEARDWRDEREITGQRADGSGITYFVAYGSQYPWQPWRWLNLQQIQRDQMLDKNWLPYFRPLNPRISQWHEEGTITQNGVTIETKAGIGQDWGIKITCESLFTPDDSVIEGWGQPLVKYITNGNMPTPPS
jgi:hypothetical protein